MKVLQKKAKDGKILLECTATEEEVNKVFFQAAVEFANQMGLRPEQNKTVYEGITEKLGIKDVDAMVQGRALEMLAPYALDKRNITPLYAPTPMATMELRRDKKFSFTLNVTPKPVYELTSYDPVSITVAPFVPDLSSVDKQIEDMAESMSTYTTAEEQHEVREGDTVKLSIKDAYMKGSNISGLNSDGRPYQLGEGLMPAGFDEAILGMMPGESKKITFDAPTWDDDGDQYMAPASCTVTVIEIQKQAKADITDEWVNTYFPMYNGVAGLRESLTDRAIAAQRFQYDCYVRDEATMALSSRFEGKIADAAYEAASKQIRENLSQQLAANNMTMQDYANELGGEQQLNMMLMVQTRQQLVAGFCLDAVFHAKKLVVKEEDIEDSLRAFTGGNPNANLKQIRKEMEESGRNFALREAAERVAAAKWVVAHAEITERDPQAASKAASEEEQTESE